MYIAPSTAIMFKVDCELLENILLVICLIFNNSHNAQATFFSSRPYSLGCLLIKTNLCHSSESSLYLEPHKWEALFLKFCHCVAPKPMNLKTSPTFPDIVDIR